jgi:8-oxo-dGTP pyrophosphatase MutT (NUDIX family)
MGRPLSCAVLLLDEPGQLLLCHVTGTRWWDVPKGLQDPGETPCQTAVRELAEETGVVLAPERLLDLGRIDYRPGKDLHLFAARRASGDVDLARCRCSSHFPDPRTGRLRPEVDAYAWVPFAEVAARCARTLGKLLSETVSLADILRRLQGGDSADGGPDAGADDRGGGDRGGATAGGDAESADEGR